jgi:hypothetical protein
MNKNGVMRYLEDIDDMNRRIYMIVYEIILTIGISVIN